MGTVQHCTTIFIRKMKLFCLTILLVVATTYIPRSDAHISSQNDVEEDGSQGPRPPSGPPAPQLHGDDVDFEEDDNERRSYRRCKSNFKRCVYRQKRRSDGDVNRCTPCQEPEQLNGPAIGQSGQYSGPAPQYSGPAGAPAPSTKFDLGSYRRCMFKFNRCVYKQKRLSNGDVNRCTPCQELEQLNGPAIGQSGQYSGPAPQYSGPAGAPAPST